jgi:nicotinate dehydrogenase subunit A
MTAARAFELNVNGYRHRVLCDPSTALVFVLRNHLNLIGTRLGCGLGQCGACTVLIDGKAERSCVTPVASVVGRKVQTVEAVPDFGGAAARLPQSFLREQAGQCGFCLSGMIMTAADYIGRGGAHDEAAIRGALDANLCRCGSHNRIVRAVRRALSDGPVEQ